MTILRVENLTYRYPDGTKALDDLSLTIAKGRKTALMGPNGAGKSTLLLHLNAIHLAQAGRVELAGQTLGREKAHWARSQVGLVFQDPDDQVFSGTVWEDVTFGPANLGWDRETIAARAQKALEQVGMEAYRDKAPHLLSYGQKKRVAIAGVLAMDPQVIILDEPDAFLDPVGRDGVFAILDELAARGVTVVIATHDVDLAVHWAEEVILLKDGRCLAQGPPSLLTDPALVREAQLRLPLITRLFDGLPGWTGERPCTIDEGVRALLRHGVAPK